MPTVNKRDADPADILLRYPDLRARGIPWSRKHIRSLITSGRFPRPLRLGENTVAWRASEIERFIASRPRAAA